MAITNDTRFCKIFSTYSLFNDHYQYQMTTKMTMMNDDEDNNIGAYFVKLTV